MQEVTAQAAVLRSAAQEAQGALESAQARLAHAASAAAPHTTVLQAEELRNADAVRGRLAELTHAASVAACSATQRSGVDGGGKQARFGNPKHPQTMAVKHALAQRHPGVLGAFAQLGSVQDAPLSELVSAHLNASLRTLVVESTTARCAAAIPCGAAAPALDCRSATMSRFCAVVPLPRCIADSQSLARSAERPRGCRVEVTELLQAHKCEVPDVLALNMCGRCRDESAALRVTVDRLPEAARALVLSACQSSEPPLAVPLPHAKAVSMLERSKKPLPQVRGARGAQPHSAGAVAGACCTTKRGLMSALWPADAVRQAGLAPRVHRLCVQPRAAGVAAVCGGPARDSVLHTALSHARLCDAA
jgi:hypothetical protein